LSDKEPDAREIENVAASLKKYGQLRPILVRPLGDGLYEIIDGHVVVDAAHKAGFKELSCVVHNLDAKDALLVYIHLKLNRTVKNHVEIRKVFQQVGDAELLANVTSWPKERIRDYIELADRDLNWREFKYVAWDDAANEQPIFGE